MENILGNFVHGFATNLGKGVINNADATLFLLAAMGGVAKGRDLKRALKSWRPNRLYNYLFQSYARYGGYGFCGSNINSCSNEVYHSPRCFNGEGHTSQRRTFWYRTGRGTYALTFEGIRRLTELGIKRA